jgi:hypothetical protein
MKRFLVALVAFFIASFLVGQMLGSGFLGLVVGLVAAVIVYMKVGSASATGGTAVASGGAAGSPTFSWKGIDVYQDEGYFTYRGRRYEISNVSRISYECPGHRSCMGGAYYKIHIHMNDLQMPRVTVGAGNVTSGGNDETERNYERLAIVLGCR